MNKKPVIGIPLTIEPGQLEKLVLSPGCKNAVERFGGIPIGLSPTIANIDGCINIIDGLLLPGGKNLHPSNYGKKQINSSEKCIDGREAHFEINMIKRAFNEGMPILGICLGMQILNVAFGGTLYQDINRQLSNTINHKVKPVSKLHHRAYINEGTHMQKIYRHWSHIWVNSNHTQAVDKLGQGFIASAYAGDGIIEAIEHSEKDFVVGVQWHPEVLLDTFDAKQLFSAFLKECYKFKEIFPYI